MIDDVAQEKIMEAYEKSIQEMKMDTLDKFGKKSVVYGKGILAIRSGASEVILTKTEAGALFRSLERILKEI